MGAALAVLAVVAWRVLALPGLAIPFALGALINLTSAPVERSLAGNEPDERPLTASRLAELETPDRQLAPAAACVVATVPLIALWASSVTANAGDAFYRRFGGGVLDALGQKATWGVALPFLFVLASVAFGGALRRLVGRLAARPVFRRWFQGALFTGVAGLFLVLWTDWGTFWVAPILGAVAVLAVFLSTVAAAVLFLRVTAREAMRQPAIRSWALPASLRLLRFRRSPLVLGVVLWALVAPLVDPGHYHDARPLHSGDVASGGRSIDQVAAGWSPGSPDADGKIPVLLVSAAGGGIRAAYWTTAVLDCVLERQATFEDPCGTPADPATVDARRARVLAASGISGGSVGLVTYESHMAHPAAALDTSFAKRWYSSVLGRDDFLSPAFARWLFRDVPNVFLRRNRGADRAAILERAWERAWTAKPSPLADGFRSSQMRSGAVFTVLNSYSVEDGCRLNVSVLDSNPARGAEDCKLMLRDLQGLRSTTTTTGGGSPSPTVTVPAPVLDATTDLVDFTCAGQDYRLSTAALLSARFPWVTPSGRLNGCRAKGSGTTFAVDGGYRDTSGASTLTELWPAFERSLLDAHPGAAFVPVFVQIDNGYDRPVVRLEDRRPSELAVPLAGQKRASGGVADAARQSAERLFGDHFVRITTKAHPGSQAPLGWLLSDSSRNDLDNQLKVNAAVIATLRCWLDGHTPCGGAGASTG
jgi:hypothetical protein